MELLDRYLKAVRFWLPSEQKQDIIAELSEDLHAQFEDKESELGRPLNEAEVEAILKKGGSPMLVAQRYHPQRYLIGPALFPMYWFVLKLGWLFFFGPWLILGIGVNLFAGGHFQELMEPFLRAVLINFAAITGVFALLERSHAQTGFAKNWTPRKLPAVRDPNRVPRSSSIRELTWYLMLALWWGNVLRIPAVPGVTIVMAPELSRLYWPILVVMLCQGIIAGVNALRPLWNPRRAALRGVVDAASLVVVGYLLAIWLIGGTFVTVTSAKLSSAQIAAGERGITHGWSVLLLIWAAASYAARVFQDVRRAAHKPPAQNWAVRILVGD
jgi:hypothetical protein